MFVCCARQPAFVEHWNSSGSEYSTALGTAAEVFSNIALHVTQDHDEPHTAETVDAARLQVGLTNNVEEGLRILNEELSFLTVQF